MAIDKEIWNKARALFEQGLSLSQIELETNINKTSISKQAKKENWEKGIIITEEREITVRLPPDKIKARLF